MSEYERQIAEEIRGLRLATERLTLRDHFAMAALAGMVATDRYGMPPQMATKAYEFADAMLEAREKK
jgi:hypothetical protein